MWALYQSFAMLHRTYGHTIATHIAKVVTTICGEVNSSVKYDIYYVIESQPIFVLVDGICLSYLLHSKYCRIWSPCMHLFNKNALNA